MTENNFTTVVVINKSAEEVFNAIKNVRGWWQGEIEGNTNKLGDEFDYRMKTFHYSKQRVTEFIPNKKIVWLVTESDLSFVSPRNEWTGTKINFELAESNDKTELRFTHEGLKPVFQCYGACSNGWEKLINESLLSLIETGEGKLVFG